MSGLSEEDRARVEEILPFVEGSVRWSALTRLLSTIDTLTRELDEARAALRTSTEGPTRVWRCTCCGAFYADGDHCPTEGCPDNSADEASPVELLEAWERLATRDESSTEGGGARVEKPRMALRPYHDDPERLDDVVVEDVAMFRAEMMDDGHLWMACYFDKNGTAPDLHFSVMAGKTGRAQLHLSATDVPPHIDIDADEPAQSDTPTDQEETP